MGCRASARCSAGSRTRGATRRGEVADRRSGSSEHIRVGSASSRRRPSRRGRLVRDGDREPPPGLRPDVGRLGPRAEVPARRRRSSSCCAAASTRWRRRRSTGWPPAACTTWSAAASTATRSTSAGSCRTSRRCCTTTRSSPSRYLHGYLALGNERYREVVDETVDYMLRELALEGGGFASAQDADTDGVEGLTFTWAPGEGAPEELLAAVRGRPLRSSAETLDAGDARAALRGARARAEAVARRQGDRLLERAGARGACRVRAVPRPCRLDRRSAPPGEFLLGPLSTATGGCTERGATASPREPATWRTTPTSRTACTSCTSRRASCAGSRRRNRLAPPRGRALRRRRARRLLPDAGRRRAARRPQEGSRRPSRRRAATRCSRTSCCGSPGSTATTSSNGARCRCSGWSATRSSVSVGLRLDARRARPALLAAARARDRRPAGLAPSRGRRSPAGTRTRSSPSGRARGFRCSRGSRSSTASRRCTSASGSPAALRSSIRPRSRKVDPEQYEGTKGGLPLDGSVAGYPSPLQPVGFPLPRIGSGLFSQVASIPAARGKQYRCDCLGRQHGVLRQ